MRKNRLLITLGTLLFTFGMCALVTSIQKSPSPVRANSANITTNTNANAQDQPDTPEVQGVTTINESTPAPQPVNNSKVTIDASDDCTKSVTEDEDNDGSTTRTDVSVECSNSSSSNGGSSSSSVNVTNNSSQSARSGNVSNGGSSGSSSVSNHSNINIKTN